MWSQQFIIFAYIYFENQSWDEFNSKLHHESFVIERGDIHKLYVFHLVVNSMKLFVGMVSFFLWLKKNVRFNNLILSIPFEHLKLQSHTLKQG